MKDLPHIRVTAIGAEPVFELMQGAYIVCGVIREEIIDMLRQLVEWLAHCTGPLDLGPIVIEPSKVDAIEMTANFSSTLRWCR